MKSMAQRFDDKWMPEPNSGCWLWIAGLSDHGYDGNRYAPNLEDMQ